MKNKKILTILTAIAFIVSGCTGNTQSSSIAPSTPSTTSEVSSNPSSDTSTSTSSADSTSATSSNTSTSTTTSSSTTSSSSAPSSSSSTTSSSYVPSGDTTWNINVSLRGAEFRNALQTIMAGKRTRTTTYDNCKALGAKAAAYPNANSSTFVPFYHDSSKLATQSECNREHTWPNSRGTGTEGPGADPFIIRPTLKSENSDRENFFYGTKGKANKEWDPASCGFEAARGESARVILYAATMYYKNGLSLSNNPNDATNLKTMGTLSTLLAWNTTYAPTPIEIQINNYLSSNGYGRNPFVDHPEYASYIWNNNGLIGGEIPPDPDDFTNGLDVESTLSNLDGNNYVIASSDSATSFTYFAMDNEAKSDKLSYYIKPLNVLVNDDKSKLIPADGVTLKYYKFIKQSDGSYYIQNKENNKYLFGYIEGNYYDIGLGSSPIGGGSLSWTITSNGKGFTMKNAANVYLEYYNGSFCGYKNAPSVPIYLYH